MLPDLHHHLSLLHAQATSATAEIERSIAAAQSPACAQAFLATAFDPARASARAADKNHAHSPTALGGLAVSVKDLFDIAGQTTRAGSVVLADAPAAQRDAVAVARLRAAGGTLIGRTHMTEFAFSGVGVNPHYGTPANATATDVPRIPGGSSSGGAVSVVTGAAHIALGSDTGGSIRIPAALHGIVGFKNTARLVPTDGALPLSTTLDTACAMTRSVRDAILAHEILAARRVVRSNAPLSTYRLAVARSTMLDGLDATVARAFDRTLNALRAAGVHIEEIALTEIADLGSIQSRGGFAAAESYHWHQHLLRDKAALYDPRVRTRIERGADMSASDYIELLQARQRWIDRTEAALAGYDAVLSPTVPIVAPPLASVAPATGTDPVADAARDVEFFRVNALLLRNPSVVNMLDGCALSLPCHAPDELPVGLMLWHGALRDDTILNLALQVERCLQQ